MKHSCASLGAMVLGKSVFSEILSSTWLNTNEGNKRGSPHPYSLDDMMYFCQYLLPDNVILENYYSLPSCGSEIKDTECCVSMGCWFLCPLMN